jgi:hypothetical protein
MEFFVAAAAALFLQHGAGQCLILTTYKKPLKGEKAFFYLSRHLCSSKWKNFPANFCVLFSGLRQQLTKSVFQVFSSPVNKKSRL